MLFVENVLATAYWSAAAAPGARVSQLSTLDFVVRVVLGTARLDKIGVHVLGPSVGREIYGEPGLDARGTRSPSDFLLLTMEAVLYKAENIVRLG
jgi:hypothetical protein